MDIELQLPLLRWLQSAPLHELRAAVRVCSRRYASQLLQSAVNQAVRFSLAPIQSEAKSETSEEEVAAEATSHNESQSITDPMALLPPAVSLHVDQFLAETIDRLGQLTDYLRTEQLVDREDSLSVLRTQVTSLVQGGNREDLEALHKLFIDKPKPRRQPISQLLQKLQEQQKKQQQEEQTSQTVVQSDQRSIAESIASTVQSDVKTDPHPDIHSPSSSMVVASAASSTTSSSIAAASTMDSISSPSPSSSSSSIPPTALHFLNSESNTDVLCATLSFLSAWDLLAIASRVNRHWFTASCDPRCFRQLVRLRLTQLVLEEDTRPPETSTVGQSEWAWAPQTSQPIHAMSAFTPTQQHFDSLTRMLSKTSRLTSLSLGPKSSNRILRAIGEGMKLNISAPQQQPFLPNLHALILRNCDIISDEGILALIAHCQGPVDEADASISSVSSVSCFLHRLHTLDLSGCREITDRGLAALFTHLPSLHHIDLSYCSGVSVVSLTALAKHCQKVSRLNVSGSRGMSDDCMRCISGLPVLRAISLEDCWNISSTGILYVANGCRHLEELNVQGTYNAVNETAFRAIVQRLSQSIKILNFTGCPLTDAHISLLCRGIADVHPPTSAAATPTSLSPTASSSSSSSSSFEFSAGGLNQLASLYMSMVGRMGPSSSEVSNVGFHILAASPVAMTIHSLDLTGCAMLDDTSVAAFASSCMNLAHLNLSRCTSLTDASIQAIGNGVFAAKLRMLDVSHDYQLTNACLGALSLCTQLRELNLKKCLRITDTCWRLALRVHASGAAPTPLQSLDLSGCKISDHGMQQLNMEWNASMRNAEAHHRQQQFPSMDLLETKLVQSPSFQIRSLHLNECVHIGDQGLNFLLPLLPHLTSISLIGCHRVGDASLKSMAVHNKRLRSVVLNQLVDISDEGIQQLCGSLPSLAELGLDDLSGLGNGSIISIANSCPNLIRLSCARATHLTFHALHVLLKHCHHLTYLNCALATQITALSSNLPEPMWQDVLFLCAKRGVQFLR